MLKVKGAWGDQNYDGWKVFEKAGPIKCSRLKAKRGEGEEEHVRRALYVPERRRRTCHKYILDVTNTFFLYVAQTPKSALGCLVLRFLRHIH